MGLRYLSCISCVLVATSACSANVEQGSPGEPGVSPQAEKTGRQGEAVNSNCTGPHVSFVGFTYGPNIFGSFPTGVSFSGYCFNGGDTVYVEIYDITSGQVMNTALVQAGPDYGNVYAPGAIVGSENFESSYPSRGDQLELFAFDGQFGYALSSPFYF